MSFAPGKLAVLACANSFSLWHYDTEDEAEQLVAPGYFDGIARLLRRGDLIFVSRVDSGASSTALFLVTEAADKSVRIECLEGNGTYHLDALRDVRIEQAQAEQVLTYDGAVWVNRSNPGIVGDSHAAIIGNPHQTCAANIGAVSVADKGVAGGVATLGEDGKVPAAQLPPMVGGGAVGSVFGPTGAITAEAGDYLADQIADTATKVLMTAEERSRLSYIEEGATAAGAAGDAFASVHAGSGGTAHATASSSEAGFLSAADKEKLDGIAPEAAPNPALATQEEVAAGTSNDPRSLTPALIKQAVVTHAPPAAPDSVGNAALANMSPARIKGRATGTGVGDPQDLTPVQVRTIINVADGATAAGALGDSHAGAIGNPHQTSAQQVGAVPAAEKGAANGVATLDATGKVPAAQLPPGSGGAIASVFGRTGAIAARAGDYAAGQIADTATKSL